MDDVRLNNLMAEIVRMRTRIGDLESQVEQLARTREPTIDTFRQIRWAQTCEPDEGDYPSSGTVFPIKFLDAHYTATPGDQSFNSTPRQSGQAAVAFCHQFIPLQTSLPVFWLRGLGDEGAGEWWQLPRHQVYTCRANGPIGTSVIDGVVHIYDATFTIDSEADIEGIHNPSTTISISNGDRCLVFYNQTGTPIVVKIC